MQDFLLFSLSDIDRSPAGIGIMRAAPEPLMRSARLVIAATHNGGTILGAIPLPPRDDVDEMQGKEAMARPPTDLRSLSRSFTELAIRTLAGIAQHSENDGARVSACGLLLDRGWGKVPQSHTGEHGEGDIRITIRHIMEGRDAPRPLDNSKPHNIEHAPIGDNESEP